MRACLALASFTGWQLSEIDEMDSEEFYEFCLLLPKDK